MKTIVAAGTTQVHETEVREWMEELGVKHHYVDMDGLHEIRFPFKFD